LKTVFFNLFLQPENLLLENENDDTPIKLTDFGLSKIYSTEMLQTACGTPGHVGMSFIVKSRGEMKRMWVLGLLLIGTHDI